jgi:8-oxo-dGTP diphosphatase
MRTTLPVAAHVFLLRQGAVLLLRRRGTGFEDGKYGLPAGHLDGGEPATAAASRECREEVGVVVAPADLRAVGMVHWTAAAGEGIDLFFAATRWAGEPTPCAECDEVRWCALGALPAE